MNRGGEREREEIRGDRERERAREREHAAIWVI